MAHYEAFYKSIVYSFFKATGVRLIPEDITSKGRTDITLIHNDMVIILEFKVSDDDDKPKNDAIMQIKQKEYYKKYLDFKNIYIVGIEFNEKKKNLIGFSWERVDRG